MTQNDFLHPLLALPPFIFFLIILICGFGSIILLAIKVKVAKNLLLKNPGFMVGDFFLLPAAGGLITFFYQSITNPLPTTTSPIWHLLTLAISLCISTGLMIKFNFLSRRWVWGIPHGIFHLFFTYLFITFVSKGFWQLMYGESNITLLIVWAATILAVLLHLILGTIWSKRILFE